jgi:ribosomal protein L28
MARNNKYQDYDIKVSARVLRHISRGIYRTPAGALKELASNAYDAGAKKLTINTGYPTFKEIVVTDNGKGIKKSDFIDVIQNIGLSQKQAGTAFKIPGSSKERITIGHYGIGILAIGQLCQQVIITSKTKGTQEGFEAILNFEQFEIKKINGINRANVKDEKLIEKRDQGSKSFAIGKCTIRKLKYAKENKETHFTRLKLERVRSFVQQKLSGHLLSSYNNLELTKIYSSDFQKLIKLYREKEKDIRHGQYPYEKLCWELAQYCPVKYPDMGEFIHNRKLSYFRDLAEDYKFEVIIDGLEITKPIEPIFFNDSKSPIKDIFVWIDEEYTKGSKVSGYLVYKKRIRPKALQGILIREAGVAVGMHDLTFMEYPYHEGTKFEQLTGELFVEGLSGALNIDRSSFNETDDRYLDLMKWFHEKLNKNVFPKIKKEMKRQSSEDIYKLLKKSISAYSTKTKKKYKLNLQPLGKKEKLFQREGNTLTINTNHPEGKPSKQKLDKFVLASILVLNNTLSSDEMEALLKEITKTQKKAKGNE